MESESDRCDRREQYIDPGSPSTSALMFSAGVIGNLIALILLEIHRRRERSRQRQSLFHILVTALVVTDLIGTCSVSPLVLASYATNRTLEGMSVKGLVCQYFGFSMTFFSLVTLAILFAMALERWFSIGHPYFYERHIAKRCGYVSIALIYIAGAGFSVLPILGFGKYMQYCPGTWCFIDMTPTHIGNKVYAKLYATLLLVIMSSVVLCNLSVICHLVHMYRRRKVNRGSTTRRIRRYNRSLSMCEEVEHLVLLIFMTVPFVVCTVPLMVRIYTHDTPEKKESDWTDLRALRFLSTNSIIDPWVFIILSPSVLRFLRGALCKRPAARPPQNTSQGTQIRLSQQCRAVGLSKVLTQATVA